MRRWLLVLVAVLLAGAAAWLALQPSAPQADGARASQAADDIDDASREQLREILRQQPPAPDPR